MADRRSPLAGYAAQLAAVAKRSDGDLGLAELPFRTQLNLRLDPQSPARQEIEAVLGFPLPLEPNTFTRGGAVSALWLGPDEWLLIAPPDTALEPRLAGLAPSLVDVSAARTIVQICGRRARDLLAHGAAIDLHPRVFGAGRCAQTRLALANVVLAGVDADEPTFWVLVRSSFAGYLVTWLLDAAAEYLAVQQSIA